MQLHRGRNNGDENLQAVDDGYDGQVQGLSGDNGGSRRTKLTGMGTAGSGIEIGAIVELRRKEDHSEKQGSEPYSMRIEEHLCTMTKLRLEWLRGQATDWAGRVTFATKRLVRTSGVLGWIEIHGPG